MVENELVNWTVEYTDLGNTIMSENVGHFKYLKF